MNRALPDALAIDIAYRSMKTKKTMQQVLADPALQKVLYNRARRHMERRERFDPKRLQANDNDF